MRRIPYDRARKSPDVHRHDYIGSYVADLANVVDMEAIRSSGVKIGIDPLGGASVHIGNRSSNVMASRRQSLTTRSIRPFGS